MSTISSLTGISLLLQGTESIGTTALGQKKITSQNTPPLNRCSSYYDECHISSLDGIKNLLFKFLLYKYFYNPSKPTIMCEGKTDNIYLKCAVENLQFQGLTRSSNGDFPIHFFNKTEFNSEMLCLAEGTPGIKYFIDTYHRRTDKFHRDGMQQPVIIVVDNDKAGRGVFDSIKKNPSPYSNEHLLPPNVKRIKNIYLFKIPSNTNNTEIEDLFDDATLNTVIDGKRFNRDNKEINLKSEYSKIVFATKVIKENQKTIDFSNFVPLLEIIRKIITTHSAH